MQHHLAGRMAGALAAGTLLLAGCASGPGGSGGSGGPGNSGGSGGSGGSQSPAAASGSALFPVAVGEKWVYADHLGALGTTTTTDTVAAVKPVSGGEQVTLTHTSDILGASKTTRLTYMFYSDGSISVPFTQINGGQVTIRSGSIVWPPASAIASGQSHTSVLAITIKSGGRTINEQVHVTVKGGGTHSVTVPAGTYRATVVEQTMAEKVLGHPVSIVVRTWLAPGVGPVQSEVLDRFAFGAGPQVREELKSFTK